MNDIREVFKVVKVSGKHNYSMAAYWTKYSVEYKINQIAKAKKGFLYGFDSLYAAWKYIYYSNLRNMAILSCLGEIVNIKPMILWGMINNDGTNYDYFWDYFLEFGIFPDLVTDGIKSIPVLEAEKETVLCKWIRPAEFIGFISGAGTNGKNTIDRRKIILQGYEDE